MLLFAFQFRSTQSEFFELIIKVTFKAGLAYYITSHCILIVAGNLTGGFYLNNYLIHGSGVFDFLGIFYLLMGRRIALLGSLLVSATFYIALVALPSNAG